MRSNEGSVEVSGAALRYRMVGAKTELPTLVFENGWSASYHYWAWIVPELAPYAQLLFYNRAGIGGSTATGPRSAKTLGQQFGAMLAALKVPRPVVVIGQSYGGLMCALQAAQNPEWVRGLVQVDGTPEAPEPTLDKVLGAMKLLVRTLMLMRRVGLPDPIFAAEAKALPPTEARALVETAFDSPASLRNALVELDLIHEIREAIGRGNARPPRLVISAGLTSERKGFLARLMASPERARQIMDLMQDAHRAQARKNGRWITLPHDHGGLVFTQAGAKATAAATLEFLRSLA